MSKIPRQIENLVEGLKAQGFHDLLVREHQGLEIALVEEGVHGVALDHPAADGVLVFTMQGALDPAKLEATIVRFRDA